MSTDNEQKVLDALNKMSLEELNELNHRLREYALEKEEKRLAWEMRKKQRAESNHAAVTKIPFMGLPKGKSRNFIKNDPPIALDKISVEADKIGLDISSLVKELKDSY